MPRPFASYLKNHDKHDGDIPPVEFSKPIFSIAVVADHGRQAKYFAGAHESQINVGANVLPTELIQKTGLFHHEKGLSVKCGHMLRPPAAPTRSHFP